MLSIFILATSDVSSLTLIHRNLSSQVLRNQLSTFILATSDSSSLTLIHLYFLRIVNITTNSHVQQAQDLEELADPEDAFSSSMEDPP